MTEHLIISTDGVHPSLLKQLSAHRDGIVCVCGGRILYKQGPPDGMGPVTSCRTDGATGLSVCQQKSVVGIQEDLWNQGGT